MLYKGFSYQQLLISPSHSFTSLGSDTPAHMKAALKHTLQVYYAGVSYFKSPLNYDTTYHTPLLYQNTNYSPNNNHPLLRQKASKNHKGPTLENVNEVV